MSLAPLSYPKLFVVGCPRSGTSWVHQMLSKHPDSISSQAETHAYSLIYEPFTSLRQWNLEKRLQRAAWILRRYGGLAILRGIQSFDLWRGILNEYLIYKQADRVGLHFLIDQTELKELMQQARQLPGSDQQQALVLIQLIFDHYFQHQGGQSTQILLEKTPLHVGYLQVILRQFPEAKVIEVIRDGRDVCVSRAARAQKAKWAKLSVQGTMKQWKRCIELGEKFRAMPEFADRIQSVRYESLIANQAQELQRMFTFAERAWDNQLIDQIITATDINRVADKGEGNSVRSGTIGEWRQRLSAKDLETCYEIAGEALARLGYMEKH
jgi:Sulfotransferase family